MMTFVKYTILLTIVAFLGLWLAQVAFSAPENKIEHITQTITPITHPVSPERQTDYEVIQADNAHRLERLSTLQRKQADGQYPSYFSAVFFNPQSNQLARHFSLPVNSAMNLTPPEIWDVSDPLNPVINPAASDKLSLEGGYGYYRTMTHNGLVTLALLDSSGWLGSGTGTPPMLNLNYERYGQSPYQITTIPNTHFRNPAALSNDGMLVAYYDASYLKIWSARTYSVIASIYEPDFNGILHFSEDGRFLLTARKDRQRIIWHLETRVFVEHHILEVDDEYESYLSPEGDYYLRFDRNQQWTLLHPDTDATIMLNTPCERAFKPVFSPDSQLIAIGANCSDDRNHPAVEIQIFAVETGELLARHSLEDIGKDTFYPSRFTLRFSPDNTLLAVGLYQHNELWGIPKQFQDTSNAQV